MVVVNVVFYNFLICFFICVSIVYFFKFLAWFFAYCDRKIDEKNAKEEKILSEYIGLKKAIAELKELNDEIDKKLKRGKKK